jgi:hypothetical protein
MVLWLFRLDSVRPVHEKIAGSNTALKLSREVFPEHWASRPPREWEINQDVVLNPDKK